MAGALVYTVLNPQKSFASMPVIDESSILVHNGQSHRFQQSANEFFGVSNRHSKLTFVELDYL
jgi:hypothetical protein